MRHLVIYIFIITLSLTISCIGQQSSVKGKLFENVSFKLQNDDNSFAVFNALLYSFILDKRFKDKTSSYYFDMYTNLYNTGIPLVRLIKKDSLEKIFVELERKGDLYNKSKIRKKYREIISNIDNYNYDTIGGANEQEEYFLKFLEQYYILPETR